MDITATTTEILWGTTMPVGLPLGGKFVQVRARGKCTIAISDEAVFCAQGEALSDLTPKVRQMLMQHIIDAIGAAGSQAASVDELVNKANELSQMAQSLAAAKLASLGLAITQFTVEAIEKV